MGKRCWVSRSTLLLAECLGCPALPPREPIPSAPAFQLKMTKSWRWGNLHMGQSSPVVQTLPQTLTLPIVFPASVIFNQVSSRLIYLHLPTTGTLLPSPWQMEVTNLHTVRASPLKKGHPGTNVINTDMIKNKHCPCQWLKIWMAALWMETFICYRNCVYSSNSHAGSIPP